MTANVDSGSGAERDDSEHEGIGHEGTGHESTDELIDRGERRGRTEYGLWSWVPLRVKLTATLLVLLALAVALIGVASTVLLRNYLIGRVDTHLATLSTGFTAQVSFACDQSRVIMPGELVIGVRYQDCRRVLKAPAYDDDDLPFDNASLPGVQGRIGEPFTVSSQDGETRWRLITTIQRGGQLVTIGEDLSNVDKSVDRLILINLLVGLGAILALAVVGVWITRRSLRPLVEIEATAAAIAGGDLGRRVPDFGPATEVGRLGGALNAMLAQIETAFTARAESEQRAVRSEERMRQFVADASHELRTPLTTIRGFAELYRQGAAGDPAAVLRRIEDEAARMGLLVEDLLLLARLDEERPLQAAPVRLGKLIQDAAAGAHAIAPDRTILVDLPPTDEGLVVLGDETRLRQVIGNLVTNALMHTPAGTPVRLGLRSVPTPEPGYAVIEVTDAGQGLTDEQAERVFERFYRVDKARTRQAAGQTGRATGDAGARPALHSGTGLGLAIVAALVAAHEGSVEVETAPGEGATFRVRLPLSVPAEPDAGGANGAAVTVAESGPNEALTGSFNSQETSSQDPGGPQRSRASSDT
jgi:two-component system OmpR family sensor kinase